MSKNTIDERKTGRTFRKALRAVLAASEGKKVLWAVGNQEELLTAREYLQEIACGHYSTPRAASIEIGTGSVDIRRAHENFVGQRYDLIIEDELRDMRFRQIEKWWFVRDALLSGGPR